MNIRYDVTVIEYCGLRTAVVLPIPPEGAPASVVEGITRRRLAMIEGACPCGAGRPGLSREQRRPAARGLSRTDVAVSITVEHEAGCPATDELLLPAIEAWRLAS